MPELLTEQDPTIKKELSRIGSMSLMEHLEELRKRVFQSAVGVAVGVALGWWKVNFVISQMEAPVKSALKANHFDPSLIYLNPTDTFNIQIKMGLIIGVFIACPWLLYQIWGFISPALYRSEKRFLLPFLFLSVILFVTGGYFGYRVVFPQAMNFLIHNGGDMKPMISITSYSDLFLTLILGLALVFEMPIVLGFAGAMGVISSKFLVSHIRGATLVMFILAGVLSPIPDIMSMCVYASPMLVLYVLSIGIVWLVHPTQRRKRREKRGEED
jgi:sec-independent protein translocase protein TatC